MHWLACTRMSPTSERIISFVYTEKQEQKYFRLQLKFLNRSAAAQFVLNQQRNRFVAIAKSLKTIGVQLMIEKRCWLNSFRRRVRKINFRNVSKRRCNWEKPRKRFSKYSRDKNRTETIWICHSSFFSSLLSFFASTKIYDMLN